ncbi:hypothetical protein ACE103_30170 [Bradyrhizobium sp. ma5]|uniref:hypothetical protein n=1 Tax=Bradyrhizobium sp. ma5 TaxID=3344828 RepID=UPI0035D47B5F
MSSTVSAKQAQPAKVTQSNRADMVRDAHPVHGESIDVNQRVTSADVLQANVTHWNRRSKKWVNERQIIERFQ